MIYAFLMVMVKIYVLIINTIAKAILTIFTTLVAKIKEYKEKSVK